MTRAISFDRFSFFIHQKFGKIPLNKAVNNVECNSLFHGKLHKYHDNALLRYRKHVKTVTILTISF